MEHVIKLIDYHYTCGDWCCDEYGTIVEVDWVEWPYHNQDTETILEQVLHLLEIKHKIICVDEKWEEH